MTKLQRFFDHLFAAFSLKSLGTRIVYGAVIGVVAGMGAVVFYTLCQAGLHLFLDRLAGYRPPPPYGEPPLFPETATPLKRWLLLVVPALGGLASGWVVYTFAPEAEGHGTDSAIDAFHNRQGRIRKRVPVVKAVASALTLGSGGSGGREGPIAQIGAGFGSFLADRLGLGAKERRIMLASGVGAGIGSIFRAPLAGALFAAEILYREPEFESEVIIPAAVSTIVAYSTFGTFFGFQPLFRQAGFAFSNPLELLPYTVLAVVVALASPLYVKCFYGVRDLFARMRIPNHVKPAIGGLLTGAVGYFLPQTLAFGYGTIQKALDAQLGAGLLLAIALGKILTTSFSIGSGGSGGVFGPSMVIGGSLGGAVGQLFQRVTPSLVPHTGAFVVVGMSGFFAAASNAPISTIIMVSEMTGNYNLLVPALWVCAIAYLLGRRWSIYEKQVPTRTDSPAHYGDFVRDLLEDMQVRDIAYQRTGFHTIPECMTLREFVPIMTATHQTAYPVVDDRGEMTGLVSINDVREILVERDLDNLLIMREVADENVPTVTPEDNLASVLQRFAEYELDTLPVVDSPGSRRLLGLIRRRDVMSSYYERLRSLEEEGRRDREGS
jgi:CIC family chloride channel protein